MNAYRITLRHGGVFELDSPNGLHAIADKLAITPANVTTAPHWVFNTNDSTAVRVDDIVAIELIQESN